MRRISITAAAVAVAVIAALGVLPALVHHAGGQPAGAQHAVHLVSTPDTLKWAEPPVLPGARLAVVQGDPSKEGLFVYRLRMPANYKIPAHVHKASENVTVLAGTFYMGVGEKLDQGSGQEMPVGGFASVPANHPHYAWTGNQETVVQVHGVGPSDLRFVNPADDPRQKK